jgi:molybdate transport system regulatory protein
MNNNEINIRFNYKIWIETDEQKGILGYGQMRLLKAINETGTLNNAMKEIGFNYRKSWSKLKEIESLLGFKIIITHRGGAEKGNTVLTEKGKRLIEAFERFHDRYEDILKTACDTATKDLLSELAKI